MKESLRVQKLERSGLYVVTALRMYGVRTRTQLSESYCKGLKLNGANLLRHSEMITWMRGVLPVLPYSAVFVLTQYRL